MIISMSDILCVTNRRLCGEDFPERLEKIAANHPAGVILREKDLSETQYRALAEQVMALCGRYRVPCILHSFVDTAIACQAEAIHLPLPILRTMSPEQKSHFKQIGTSCHSVEEALEAQGLGSTYVTAGHIFATDCKKGLPGRGTDFLRNVCENVSVPVYAIGGINHENMELVREAGAQGACVMSGLMQCENVESYLKLFERAEKRPSDEKRFLT
ncbi:MAG: thiamine phosphate synthase [Lachnospiraceae bacterium]